MPSEPDHAKIYSKMHQNRADHVDQAHRSRDFAAKLAAMQAQNSEDRMTVFAMVSVSVVLFLSTVLVYSLTQLNR